MADSGDRLSLAAVSISTILSKNGTKHGIFGGWAVNILGGLRVTKDIDCLAAIGKDELLELMAKQENWTKIPNMRDDYTAFFWDDHLKRPILVEIFVGSTNDPANTENAMRAMETVNTQAILVHGSPVQLLDVVSIFKGKLHAAAGRHKLSDVADLVYLVDTYEEHLRDKTAQFSSRDIEKAVRRYPQIAMLFSRLGVNLPQTQQHIQQEEGLMGPPEFDVQRGIIE